MTPKTMSVNAALERYGIGRTKLYALIAAGSVTARKFGARTLIDVATADRYFDELPRMGNSSQLRSVASV